MYGLDIHVFQNVMWSSSCRTECSNIYLVMQLRHIYFHFFFFFFITITYYRCNHIYISSRSDRFSACCTNWQRRVPIRQASEQKSPLQQVFRANLASEVRPLNKQVKRSIHLGNVIFKSSYVTELNGKLSRRWEKKGEARKSYDTWRETIGKNIY